MPFERPPIPIQATHMAPQQITEATLRAIAPTAPKNVGVFVPYINDTLAHYEINTLTRAAMFFAQVAHESGGFRYVRELASGKAYEMRKDLGNIIEGDGVKYKGRGLIQITGRFNYRALGTALGVDLVAHPELLESPQYAVKSAGWYWDKRKLNELADIGDFEGITRKINGGINGLADRHEYLVRAMKALTPLYI